MEQERLLHMEFLQPSVLTPILLCPQEHAQAEAGAEETHLPSLVNSLWMILAAPEGEQVPCQEEVPPV